MLLKSKIFKNTIPAKEKRLDAVVYKSADATAGSH